MVANFIVLKVNLTTMFFALGGCTLSHSICNNHWLCEGALPRTENLLGEGALLRRDLTKRKTAVHF